MEFEIQYFHMITLYWMKFELFVSFIKIIYKKKKVAQSLRDLNSLQMNLINTST